MLGCVGLRFNLLHEGVFVRVSDKRFLRIGSTNGGESGPGEKIGDEIGFGAIVIEHADRHALSRASVNRVFLVLLGSAHMPGNQARLMPDGFFNPARKIGEQAGGR